MQSPSLSKTRSDIHRQEAPVPPPATQPRREQTRRQSTPPAAPPRQPPAQASAMERLVHLVSHWTETLCADLNVESDVFQQDMSHCYIFKEDILQFYRQEMISVTVIVSYMRYVSL